MNVNGGLYKSNFELLYLINKILVCFSQSCLHLSPADFGFGEDFQTF